jgi:TetR/AcrR family transcriptional regulator, transcriptional repressor of aconitase
MIGMPKVSQAHLDARRTQIIEAASRCFLRAGLHGTTIPEIIRESGLSAGAIYSYFTSKDEIIEAIARDRHDREQQLFVDACHQADLEGALEQLSQHFFGSLHEVDEQERRRLGIQFWAEALQNERVLALVRRGIDLPRKHLADMISDAQRRGALRPDLKPDAVARVLIGLYHGLVLQQAWDEHTEIEAYLAVMDVMLRAILAESSTAAKHAPNP